MSLWKNSLLILFCSIVLGMNHTYAQREIYADSVGLKDRLYYGGNFGFQFGLTTLIDVSPLVGVMITDKLSTGLGATFQYFDDNRFQGSTGSSYGGRVFGRYNLLPNIFAYTELESINWNAYSFVNERFERTWTEAFFVGAGYFAPFGSRGGANFTFLYNLKHDNRFSYYSEPYVIRVGFVL